MKTEEIIELARQAGMAYEDKLEVYVANIDDLQDFAKLVAEKERERLADIAQKNGNDILAMQLRGEV